MWSRSLEGAASNSTLGPSCGSPETKIPSDLCCPISAKIRTTWSTLPATTIEASSWVPSMISTKCSILKYAVRLCSPLPNMVTQTSRQLARERIWTPCTGIRIHGVLMLLAQTPNVSTSVPKSSLHSGRNAGSVQRRCGGVSCIFGSWCDAAYASAKCSRLLPEVFDDRSQNVCLLPRQRTIIREVNETVFAHLWRLAVLLVLSHVQKWVTSNCLLTWHHLLLAVSSLFFLTLGHQVSLGPARQLSADCSRAVPLEVVRWFVMILLWDHWPYSNLCELLNHRMRQKLLLLGRCWVVHTWMRTSSVCFVLFLMLLTLIPGWAWAVSMLIQFFSTAGDTTWVSSVIWLRLILSTMLLSTLVSSSLSKKAGEQRFIIDARVITSPFFGPSSGPLFMRSRTCQVEFQGASERRSELVCRFSRY